MKSRKAAPSKASHTATHTDVSLLSNDELRPWTIDAALEEQLSEQMESLEQTISFTSPQKACGQRGDSELDIPLRDRPDFRETVRDQLRASQAFERTFERRFEPFTTAMRARGVQFVTHAEKVALMCAEEREREREKETKSKTAKAKKKSSSAAVTVAEDSAAPSLAEVKHTQAHAHTHTLSLSTEPLRSPRPELLSRSPSFSSSSLLPSPSPQGETQRPKTSCGRESDADALLAERLLGELRRETMRAHSQTLRARPGTVPAVRYQELNSPAILSMRKGEFADLSSSPTPTLTQRSQPTQRSPSRGAQTQRPRYQTNTESAAMLQSFASPHHTAPHPFGASLSDSLSHSFSSKGFPSKSTASYKYMQALKHRAQSPSSPAGQGESGRFAEENELFSSMSRRAFSSNDCSLLVKPLTLSPVKSPARSAARMKNVPQHK